MSDYGEDDMGGPSNELRDAEMSNDESETPHFDALFSRYDLSDGCGGCRCCI